MALWTSLDRMSSWSGYPQCSSRYTLIRVSPTRQWPSSTPLWMISLSALQPRHLVRPIGYPMEYTLIILVFRTRFILEEIDNLFTRDSNLSTTDLAWWAVEACHLWRHQVRHQWVQLLLKHSCATQTDDLFQNSLLVPSKLGDICCSDYC